MLIWLLPILAFGQKTQQIFPAMEDTTLVVQPGGRSFSADGPIYIVNANSVIYQESDLRKYLAADLATFRFPKQYGNSKFALDKNGVYFRGERVETDTTGFVYITEVGDYQKRDAIWKTASKVYRNTSEIKDADAKTFKNTPGSCQNFFYDKDNYFFFDKKIDASETVEISAIKEPLCSFETKVFSAGKLVTLDGELLLALNAQFAKTSKKVIHIETARVLELDPKKAKVLSRSYISDGKNLYCGFYKVEISQQFLSKIKVFDHYNSRYLTDGKKFLDPTGFMAKIDAATFGLLPNSDLYFDKNGIYRNEFSEKLQKVVNVKYPFKYSLPVKASDIRFSQVNYRYLVYKNQVYDVADKEYYASVPSDKIAKLLTTNIRLIKLDGKTQDRFDYDYRLYKVGTKIYANGKDTGADAATFGLSNGLYKDKNHVYNFVHGGELSILDGIDAPSAVNRMGFIFDRNFVYLHGFRVIENSNAEILALFSGYRPGCGLDKTPNSDFYLLRNADGFWLVKTEVSVTKRFLGKTLPPDWHSTLTTFEVK